MSLSLLLDEQISAVVAAQVQSKRAAVAIESVHHWRGGAFLGKRDDFLLAAAAEESLTLVTCDLKTIPTLLVETALLGQSHGGVVFVDDSTIASSDIGSFVKALLALWEQCRAWDWRDRAMFLAPAE
jgi:hypothetical protein